MKPLRDIIRSGIIALMIYGAAHAQVYELQLQVVDGDTRQPIDSVTCSLSGARHSAYRVEYTDTTGRLTIQGLKKGRYGLFLFHPRYKTYQGSVSIKDSAVHKQVLLYHIHSPHASEAQALGDLAERDFMHGGFAMYFYAPPVGQEPGLYDVNMGVEWLYSYKTKLTSYNQLGIDLIPVKLVWHSLFKDTLVTKEIFDAERYFGWYSSVFVYNRLIMSRQRRGGFLGAFLDIGLGYEFPITYKYSYRPSRDSKYILKRLHKYNEVSAIARLGFDYYSIKAS